MPPLRDSIASPNGFGDATGWKSERERGDAPYPSLRHDESMREAGLQAIREVRQRAPDPPTDPELLREWWRAWAMSVPPLLAVIVLGLDGLAAVLAPPYGEGVPDA